MWKCPKQLRITNYELRLELGNENNFFELLIINLMPYFPNSPLRPLKIKKKNGNN